MDVQGEYDRTLVVLNELVELRTEHMTEGCSSAPMCMGMPAYQVLLRALSADRGARSALLLVALGEIASLRRQFAEVTDRLGVQRGLTNDVVQALELAGDRADEAEAQARSQAARADAAEAKLGAALAELTAWEDASDVLGPVGYPVEE